MPLKHELETDGDDGMNSKGKRQNLELSKNQGYSVVLQVGKDPVRPFTVMPSAANELVKKSSLFRTAYEEFKKAAHHHNAGNDPDVFNFILEEEDPSEIILMLDWLYKGEYNHDKLPRVNVIHEGEKEDPILPYIQMCSFAERWGIVELEQIAFHRLAIMVEKESTNNSFLGHHHDGTYSVTYDLRIHTLEKVYAGEGFGKGSKLCRRIQMLFDHYLSVPWLCMEKLLG